MDDVYLHNAIYGAKYVVRNKTQKRIRFSEIILYVYSQTSCHRKLNRYCSNNDEINKVGDTVSYKISSDHCSSSQSYSHELLSGGNRNDIVPKNPMRFVACQWAARRRRRRLSLSAGGIRRLTFRDLDII